MSGRYEGKDINAVLQDTLRIQDASNLSGVLHAWADMQAIVRADAFSRGIAYETHPVNILLLSKITSLMRVQSNSIGSVNRLKEDGEEVDLFDSAYEWITDLLEGKKL